LENQRQDFFTSENFPRDFPEFSGKSEISNIFQIFNNFPNTAPKKKKKSFGILKIRAFQLCNYIYTSSKDFPDIVEGNIFWKNKTSIHQVLLVPAV
jgi:hypothetical protein